MKDSVMEKLLACLIIIILFGAGYLLNLSINQYKSVDDYQELMRQNIIQEKLILKGEWEYYPNEIIFPNRFYSKQVDRKVQVPYELDEDVAFATFRKIIKISPDAELGLLNSEKNGNINIFINKLYIHKNNMYPYYLSLKKSNKLEIVVHMKNDQITDVFKGNIAVASYQTIYSEHENFIRLQQTICFLLIMLGTYFFLLYILAGRNKAILLYAIFTFLVGVLTLFMGSRYVQQFIDIPELVLKQVEMLIGIAVIAIYRMFVKEILKDKLKFSKITDRLVVVVFIASVIVVILCGRQYYYGLYWVAVILYMIYLAMLINKTVGFLLEKDIEGLIFICSFYIFIICGIALVVKRYILYDMELILFGVTVSIIIQSLYFAIELYRKLQRANRIAEENQKMFEKVQEFNEILDQRITERTRELEELVKRDPLTELYNHPYTIRLLEQAVQQENACVHMFMADLDNFKKINDEHGHIIGDSVIIRVSEILSKHRDVATFGRCGGEEFLGFAHNMTLEAFKELVEDMRKELEAITFENMDGGTFSVTISGGISSYEGQSLEKLMKQADDRLYKAKSLGKNRICY